MKTMAQVQAAQAIKAKIGSDERETEIKPETNVFTKIGPGERETEIKPETNVFEAPICGLLLVTTSFHLFSQILQKDGKMCEKGYPVKAAVRWASSATRSRARTLSSAPMAPA